MYIYVQCNNDKNNDSSSGNNNNDDKNEKEFGFENKNKCCNISLPKKSKSLFIEVMKGKILLRNTF